MGAHTGMAAAAAAAAADSQTVPPSHGHAADRSGGAVGSDSASSSSAARPSLSAWLKAKLNRPKPNTTAHEHSHSHSHSTHASSSLPPSHQMSSADERAARAPTADPPIPCTFVLSNLALYLFPPAIPIELDGETPTSPKQRKYFLVYTEYRRIALQDMLLVSLPYRMGITRNGGDFALRITDFTLHLRDGSSSLWLMAPPNGRSHLVECISDAYSNLMGLSLELHQVDYSGLISDILTGRIWPTVRELQIQRWAKAAPIKRGWLMHRTMHVWPATHGGPHAADTDAAASTATPTDWVKKYFVLTSDNFLLHFASSREFDAFQFLVSECVSSSSSSSSVSVSGPFPGSFADSQIDLAKSLYLRTAHIATEDGFEIIVYPRTSSMETKEGQEVREFGYTRHLFQIAPEENNTQPGGKDRILLVGSKVGASPHATAASVSFSAGVAPPMRVRVAADPAREAEVAHWLHSLRRAMKGPGLPNSPDPTPHEYPHSLSVAPPAPLDCVLSPDPEGVFGVGTPAKLRAASMTLTAAFTGAQPEFDASLEENEGNEREQTRPPSTSSARHQPERESAQMATASHDHQSPHHAYMYTHEPAHISELP